MDLNPASCVTELYVLLTGLFPVAIAIVDAQNTENWTWFLSMLKENISHPEEVVYVSDRAGGLLHAFDEVYESPKHFYCLFHIMKNLNSMYKGRRYTH